MLAPYFATYFDAMAKQQKPHYYKFMSLQNAQWVMETLLYSRLHASRVKFLNDPMECAYQNSKNKIIWSKVFADMDNLYVCSLSKSYKNFLMWSHYADGHRGCCLEVSAKKNLKGEPVEIKYVDMNELPSKEDAKTLLSYKLKCWEYENEVRYIRKDEQFNVNIHKIIFGISTPNGIRSFYTTIIKKINSGIKATKMDDNEFDYDMGSLIK